MKSFALVILSILSLIQICPGEEKVSANDAIGGKSSSSTSTVSSKKPIQIDGAFQLESRTFDSLTSDGNVWLIEFYAPWCSHCQRFAAQYEAVALQLHEKHDRTERKVMVGKIDGAKERALASRFSVRGYPTFYLIDGWAVREYEGSRSVKGLIDFSTEKYKDVEAIPFINSPYGPMGQVRSVLMIGGSKILDLYDYLVEKRSFSPAIAAIFLGGVGVMIGIFTIISIGLMIEPKPKSD